jgi:hypothetical protein
MESDWLVAEWDPDLLFLVVTHPKGRSMDLTAFVTDNGQLEALVAISRRFLSRTVRISACTTRRRLISQLFSLDSSGAVKVSR